MINRDNLDQVGRATAYDSDGTKIGSVDQIYLDDQDGDATWVSINTGLFGTSTSLAPLAGARMSGDDLHLAHSKDKIKDAPRVDADQHLSPSEEQELYRYYGLDYGTGTGTGTDTVGTGTGTGTSTTGTGDADLGRGGDDASVVRKEERLDVGTEQVEAGRVRLRKYTTTEEQQVTVPVTQERLTVERTSLDGETTSDPIATDGDVQEDIVLREERPVVDKETVAVEEVRVGKEQVTEDRTVSEEVRKEHVEIDGDDTTGDRR